MTNFKLLIPAFPILFSNGLMAQNLVPNGGFESYMGPGHCKYWTQAQGDFNHFYHNEISVNNGDAANGSGYHCLCMYGLDENEFMHVALGEPMQKGKVYALSMNVRMSTSADQVFKNTRMEKFRNLDWYFTAIPVNVLHKLFITAEPSASFKFEYPQPGTWTELTTEYIAQGGERFLTIGNLTRLYDKIMFDEKVSHLKTRLLELEEAEKYALDSVRNLYAGDMKKHTVTKDDVYSYNPYMKDKKMSKRAQKKYAKQVEKNSAIGHKIGTGQAQVERKYTRLKSEVNMAIGKEKQQYEVNVCFDDISIHEIKGRQDETDFSLAALKPETGKTIVLKNILFKTNAYTLLPESDAQLTELVQWLQKYPEVKLQVSGHTDNTGKESLNEELSKNRAKAVSDYLVTQGIDHSRLAFKGYGSKLALADNTTEAGRSLNRRVEITLMGE